MECNENSSGLLKYSNMDLIGFKRLKNQLEYLSDYFR